MPLYVVLHHRQDPHQPWINAWLDDDLIEAIQTTNQLGRLCEQAMNANEPVFVHRCGLDSIVPTISCSASVAQAAPIDKTTHLVTFASPKRLSSLPPVTPAHGQNFYIA